MTPWLSADEINDLCAPLKQAAAQCRFLRDTFGIEPKRKPDGSVLVMRSQFESHGVVAPSEPQNQPKAPNVLALQTYFRKGA